jgi:hypothetical protein
MLYIERANFSPSHPESRHDGKGVQSIYTSTAGSHVHQMFHLLNKCEIVVFLTPGPVGTRLAADAEGIWEWGNIIRTHPLTTCGTSLVAGGINGRARSMLALVEITRLCAHG